MDRQPRRLRGGPLPPAMRDHRFADLLAERVREIQRQLEEPGGLDRLARGLEFFDAWAAHVKAARVYGSTPWEAGALECAVIYNGTFRFSPNVLHDPLPGIPRQWLHSGGPDGTDDRLRVNPGRSLDNRIRDWIEKTGNFRERGVLYYVTTLPKSQFGFAGVQTQAYSVTTFNAAKPQQAGEKVIRLSRAKV
jgi:hypothetical protein